METPSNTEQDVKPEQETEVQPEPTDEAETPEEEVEEEVTDKEETRENERIRELVAEKNAYAHALEAITQANRPQPTTTVEEPLEIDENTDKALKRQRKQMDQEYGSVVSAMAEEIDELKSNGNIPDYQTNKPKIDGYKREYLNRTGRHITRWEAYAHLLARGEIKSTTKPSAEPTVNRKKTKVVTETKTSAPSKGTGPKAFKDMSLDEKEKYLEGKNF